MPIDQPTYPITTEDLVEHVGSYADSVGSGSVPDADASTKGKVQLAGDLGGTAASPTVPGLAAHVADTTDAHDASAISFVPTGTIAATTVQAAIVEAAAEAVGTEGPPGPTGSLDAASGFTLLNSTSGRSVLVTLSSDASALVLTEIIAEPTEFAGLLLWLDGEDLTPGEFATWVDRSDEANDATAPGGFEPTATADAINGLPAMEYNADTRLEIPSVDLADGEGIAVYALVKPSASTPPERGWFVCYGTGYYDGWWLGNGSDGKPRGQAHNGTQLAGSSSFDWKLLELHYTPTPSLTINRDGVLEVASSPYDGVNALAANAGLRIGGGRILDGTDPGIGQLASLLVYRVPGGAQAAPDKAGIRAYLSDRYNHSVA